MFAKLKLRARLILVGRRFSVFFHTLLFFLLRLFCFLCIIVPVLVFILLISQRSEHLWSSESYFFLVCALLFMISLISTYFFSWLGLKRSLYFEKLIEGEGSPRQKKSFSQEISTCLKSIYAAIAVFIIKLLWFLFFCSPALTLLFFLYFQLSSKGLAENVFYTLSSALVCLFIFGSLFYFCTVQRYLLVVRIVGLDGLKLSGAIKKSTRLLDGSSAAIGVFKLGLAAWYLLTPLLIPAFYITPYSRLSFELLCKKYMSGELKNTEESADINLFSTKRLPQI